MRHCHDARVLGERSARPVVLHRHIGVVGVIESLLFPIQDKTVPSHLFRNGANIVVAIHAPCPRNEEDLSLLGLQVRNLQLYTIHVVADFPRIVQDVLEIRHGILNLDVIRINKAVVADLPVVGGILNLCQKGNIRVAEVKERGEPTGVGGRTDGHDIAHILVALNSLDKGGVNRHLIKLVEEDVEDVARVFPRILLDDPRDIAHTHAVRATHDVVDASPRVVSGDNERVNLALCLGVLGR